MLTNVENSILQWSENITQKTLVCINELDFIDVKLTKKLMKELKTISTEKKIESRQKFKVDRYVENCANLFIISNYINAIKLTDESHFRRFTFLNICSQLMNNYNFFYKLKNERLIPKLDYIFYYFYNYKIDDNILNKQLITLEKVENIVQNIKDDFEITLSRSLDFIETLIEEYPNNASVYDFLIVKSKFESHNKCKLDYIYPIYETKTQRPELISKIIIENSYYDEDEQEENEKYKKLKLKKDENGDYEYAFTNNMFDDNKQSGKSEAAVSRKLAKISGGSEKLFYKNSARYHRITKSKAKKWLKKYYSNISYEKFLELR